MSADNQVSTTIIRSYKFVRHVVCSSFNFGRRLLALKYSIENSFETPLDLGLGKESLTKVNNSWVFDKQVEVRWLVSKKGKASLHNMGKPSHQLLSSRCSTLWSSYQHIFDDSNKGTPHKMGHPDSLWLLYHNRARVLPFRWTRVAMHITT